MARITAAQRKTFLDALAEGNSPEKAARAASTSRRTILRVRQEDEQFRLDYYDAHEAGMDLVEQVLLDMSLGRVKAEAARFSPTIAVLNARRSDIYRNPAKPEKQAPVTRRRRLKNLTPEELRELERLLEKTEAE